LTKAKKAVWYQANRERVLARVRANTAANPQRISAYHAEHYAANADRIKAYVSGYRATNPEKKAQLENRRRVRKTGNGGTHTVEAWRTKCAEFNHRCAYCGETKPLTRDHVIPLSRGGSDDISNIVPACRSCNSRKNAKPLNDFVGGTNHQKIDLDHLGKTDQGVRLRVILWFPTEDRLRILGILTGRRPEARAISSRLPNPCGFRRGL
jgi:5-methylcytosine-specific restriction endonuclease McrA